MLMSTSDCIKHWRKGIVLALGQERADIAIDNMRRVIDRAKKAEDEGRIKDMQPAFATINTAESIAEGFFFIEIIHFPVVDGVKGDRQRTKVTVLRPHDKPKDFP